MKVEIGNAILYLGDCIDILPTLNNVDAVITDPPYEADAHTPMRRTNSSIKSGVNDVIDFSAITEDLRDWVAKQLTMQSRGWVLCFGQVEAMAAWRQSAELADGKWRRAMCWVKPDSSPQFNGQGPAQGYECVATWWAGSGASKWNAGGKRGVYMHNCNTARFGGHPTEKPIALMCELIGDFVGNGETILDPFMGSGTTGVAAIQLGRKFIGIEREPKYFDIACKRIKQAVSQGQLFEPEKTKQIQEAMF